MWLSKAASNNAEKYFLKNNPLTLHIYQSYGRFNIDNLFHKANFHLSSY